MRGAVGALVLVAAMGVATAQEADKPWAVGVPEADRAKALELFRAGNAFFERSQFSQALAEYTKAIERWDHPAIRFNMAVSLVNLDQPIEAYRNLELALKYGAEPLGDKLFADGQTFLKLLRDRLARLTIVSEHDAAEVTLDGQTVLSGPGRRTSMVLPNAHQIVASKAGFVTTTQTVTPQGGKETVVEIELVEIGSNVEVVMVRRWAPWKPWAVVGGGALVALLGVPVRMSAASDMKAHDDQIATLCPSGCAADEIPPSVSNLESRSKTESTIAVSLFAVGAATALTGGVLVWLNRERAVTVEPTIGAEGAGVSLTFEF